MFSNDLVAIGNNARRNRNAKNKIANPMLPNSVLNQLRMKKNGLVRK